MYTTDMKNDELVDVVDLQDNVVGQELKSIVHEKGLRHRVCAVLLQNENGEYLIPTASDKKVEAGGLYHSSAGHVITGQTYTESAKRELLEETHIKTDQTPELLGNFWLEKDYPTRIEKEYFAVFRIHYKPSMGPVIFNEEQINEQWMTEETLKNLYLRNPEILSYPLQLSCKYIFKFEQYH
jgi:isopentenyldiphosphate isomerase